MSDAKHVVAVDWGTSHLRAYLCHIDKNNKFTLVDQRNALGVNKVTKSFEKTLLECIEPWKATYSNLSIIMAGQITSSLGWRETPYLSCPTQPKEIASACKTIDCVDHQITLTPGLSCLLSNDHYDVMRGEELQVLGWLALSPQHQQGKHLICLPGTHTKWVLVNNGTIELFKTAMTGELFDLLSTRSVLIQSDKNEFCLDAFNKGALFTLHSELGSFTHGLFSARSKQLFGDLSAEHANSYLSGLLIGSDVRAAMNAEEWSLKSLKQVSIIGTQQLSSLFANVLQSHNITTQICDVSETTLLGFNSVYNQWN